MSRGPVHNAMPRSPLQSALARVVGDSTGASGLERYGETLTPVVDLWRQPEWWHLQGLHRYSARFVVAAVAGEYGYGVLVSPYTPVGTSNNTIAVVTSIKVSCIGAAMSYYVYHGLEGVYTGTIAPLGPIGEALDSRWLSPPQTHCYSGTDPAFLGAGPLDYGISGSSTMLSLDGGLPYILAPFRALAVVNTTVNTAFNVVFSWYERRISPTELP